MRVSHAPVYRRRRRVVLAVLVAIVGLGLGYGTGALVWPRAEAEAAVTPAKSPTPTETPEASSTPTPSATPASSPSASPTPSPSPTFDLTAYSLTDPDSPWVIVNKLNPIDPAEYAPEDLTRIAGMSSAATMRAEAAAAMSALHEAAVAAGAPFTVSTAYRDHATQSSLYYGYVNRSGQASADRYSARPGFSEHQTGLAADIHNGVCDLKACFGTTAAGRYVAEHAWEHGFVIRYPEGKQEVTGYIYEPWHLRYVGVELATALHESDVTTLEELFGLPAAPDYS
ncbi:M15 family metallopeptidase [Demequina sp. SYSU T00039]|uniref:M15 family metallopeptidase n=1 Tax=Demequina lignilytica TaxID=3051663 RepID=A0AAW7M2X0_9MICO|nr:MULTISPECIES: M15 family metallopeptidase [unclassified Demequina]MDN4477570.1 M15 family metallopeptidase [Demequina sp. SYSU T00039-1]MDN4488079.1 M15 family metallopeptidase [Demequina sp. SYSU T00039]